MITRKKYDEILKSHGYPRKVRDFLYDDATGVSVDDPSFWLNAVTEKALHDQCVAMKDECKELTMWDDVDVE